MGGAFIRARGWFSELKRRGVLHVTGLYAIGAWAVVQLVDAISGPFPLPETALRLIWFAALLGLPVAVVFGWRYDITKNGIVRTHRRLTHGEDVPIGRADYAAIGGVVLVMAGLVVMTSLGVMDAIEQARLDADLGMVVVEPPENTIAVLPFTLCGDADPTDEALADGLTSEVINRLATQRTMKVVARTSSYTIAAFDIALPEMGRRLGVSHLLTGTVCREADLLRVTVELVDEGGFVVWTETFEQSLKESAPLAVALGVRIATGVSEALGDASPDLRAMQKVDPRAYEHFLIAEQFLQAEDYEKARAEYEKALEIQPEYPEAILALGELAAAGATRAERLESLRGYIDQAMAMARQQIDAGTSDFRAHATLGKIFYRLARIDQALAWRNASELGEQGVAELKAEADVRLAESEQHLRTALALNPADIDTYYWLAAALERQGTEREGEALEIMEAALAIEPFNGKFSIDVAKRLAARGRYREGLELLERFESLPSMSSGAYWGQLEIMNNHGQWADLYEKWVQLLREQPRVDDPEKMDDTLVGYLWWFPVHLEQRGLGREAAWWYEQGQALPDPGGYFKRWFSSQYLNAIGRIEEAGELILPEPMSDEQVLDDWHIEVWHRIAYIAWSGDLERAIRLSEALHHQKESPYWAERQAWGDLSLASYYLEVGRREDAMREAEAVVSLSERQIEAGLRHPEIFMNLATAYAYLGSDRDTLEMLEKHVQHGGLQPAVFLRGAMLERDSGWREWVERHGADPRFLAVMDQAEANRDQQAQRILAVNRRHDLDALLSPLVARVRARSADAEKPD